jgi:hypothetical protein
MGDTAVIEHASEEVQKLTGSLRGVSSVLVPHLEEVGQRTALSGQSASLPHRPRFVSKPELTHVR